MQKTRAEGTQHANLDINGIGHYFTTQPLDRVSVGPALEACGDVVPSLPQREVAMDIEFVARAIWLRQQREVAQTNPNGMAARLAWRSNAVPDKFWDSYVLDAKAAVEVIVITPITVTQK